MSKLIITFYIASSIASILSISINSSSKVIRFVLVLPIKYLVIVFPLILIFAFTLYTLLGDLKILIILFLISFFCTTFLRLYLSIILLSLFLWELLFTPLFSNV